MKEYKSRNIYTTVYGSFEPIERCRSDLFRHVCYFFLLFILAAAVIRISSSRLEGRKKKKMGVGSDLESLSEATSGAIGALVSTTVLYPLDTCKTKYQAEVQKDGICKYRYGSSPSLTCFCYF